ncbi:MAG: flavin reductase [Bacteroidetes bacterium]|nr:flavin reductase [Bacteroidota bacterium]
MKINANDLSTMEQRYRATLINSLAGVRQVALVGTQSPDGVNNLAIFNSLIHIGANPPLYGLLFRPATVRRDTLTNIFETGSYTINFPSSRYFMQSHQTSAKYGEQESEFDEVGLTAAHEPNVHAPFVKEAIVKMAMKYEEKVDISINGTIMIIGSIQMICLPDRMVSEDGYVGHDLGDTLACAGLDAYYRVSEIGRLSYARPGQWSEPVERTSVKA